MAEKTQIYTNDCSCTTSARVFMCSLDPSCLSVLRARVVHFFFSFLFLEAKSGRDWIRAVTGKKKKQLYIIYIKIFFFIYIVGENLE